MSSLPSDSAATGAQTEKRLAYHRKMTETPVEQLIIRLALPCILTMMITSIYNTADTYFVSQLGTAASAAVGVCFSVMSIIQTIGFTLGMGASNTVSRLLGQGNDQQASEVASTAFFTAGTIGGMIALFGTLFCSDLMVAIGATETILPYAITYAAYILLAAPVMAMTFTMNNLLRGEGKAFLAMMGVMSGGLLNLLLDPLFIFALDLGIAGAALATAISQCVSFSILLSMFLRKKTSVWLSPSNVRGPRVLMKILMTGSPTLCRQGLGGIAAIVMNRAAGQYGDAAIAAMAIVNRIMHLMNNLCIGMNQGFQPVAGYNIGAKKYDRVCRASKFIAVSAMILKAVIAVAVYTFAPQILTLFRADDPQVISFGTKALRLACLTAPLFSIYTAASISYQSAGRSGIALSLAFLRQGVFYIPLMLILPYVMGELGVQIVSPLSDFFSAAISFPFYLSFLKQMKNLAERQDTQ